MTLLFGLLSSSQRPLQHKHQSTDSMLESWFRSLTFELLLVWVRQSRCDRVISSNGLPQSKQLNNQLVVNSVFEVPEAGESFSLVGGTRAVDWVTSLIKLLAAIPMASTRKELRYWRWSLSWISFLCPSFAIQRQPAVHILVLLGEVGGIDNYKICDPIKYGRISKPLIAWCIGTCASGWLSTELVCNEPHWP